MSDLISRQAAIDAMEQQAEAMGNWSERYAEQRRGILTAINIVSDLPSAQPEVLACGNGELDAQPEQRWISCSERLPEEDGEYLVESTRGYEVLYYREEEKQFGLMVVKFDGNVGFVPKKVYEWMPIPGVDE